MELRRSWKVEPLLGCPRSQLSLCILRAMSPVARMEAAPPSPPCQLVAQLDLHKGPWSRRAEPAGPGGRRCLSLGPVGMTGGQGLSAAVQLVGGRRTDRPTISSVPTPRRLIQTFPSLSQLLLEPFHKSPPPLSLRGSASFACEFGS